MRQNRSKGLISARVKDSRDENFQLATYFHYPLSVRHETDRQTDNDHHSIMPPPRMRAGA